MLTASSTSISMIRPISGMPSPFTTGHDPALDAIRNSTHGESKRSTAGDPGAVVNVGIKSGPTLFRLGYGFTAAPNGTPATSSTPSRSRVAHSVEAVRRVVAGRLRRTNSSTSRLRGLRSFVATPLEPLFCSGKLATANSIGEQHGGFHHGSADHSVARSPITRRYLVAPATLRQR